MKVYIFTISITFMELGEKDFKNISIVLMILLLAILSFYLVRPLINAIIGGLILAYVFTPAYKKLNQKLNSPTISSILISVLIILVIFIPLWFLIPKIIQQVFSVFSASQSIDFQHILKTVFPSASQDFISQTAIATSSFVGKASSTVLGSLGDTLLDIPSIALQLLVTVFVFFFGLRDSDKLKDYMAGLSPFSKSKEGLFVRQFKDITDSVLYGIIIVGLFQGLTAGFGLLIFGVENTLVLTIVAIFFSVIPFVGPSVVWVPVNIYLFTTRSSSVGLAYLIYNLIVVSTIDNIIRSYIVSRKSNISPVIVIIGIIGGTLLFGIMGIIIGPLVLAYLLMFLKAYREKKIYSLFYEE